MHNWRLLLLLFLAVYQPIAAFTEPNLVDGRDQCCEHPDQDHRLAHGPRFKSEDQRRNHRVEIREDRRNEIPVNRYILERPSFERRLASAHSKIRAREHIIPRFERTDYRREIGFQRRDDPTPLHGKENRIRSAQRPTRNDINQENIRERFSKNGIRQNDRVSRLSFNRDSSQRFRQEQRTRNAMDTRLDAREYRDVVEKRERAQETRETRNLLQRARDEVAQQSSQRRGFRKARDTREKSAEQQRESRSESRRYNDMERRTSDQRAHDFAELGRPSFELRSIDRVRNVRDEHRMNRQNAPNERRSRKEVEGRDRHRQLDERAARDRTTQHRRESFERPLMERSLRESKRIRNIGDTIGLEQRGAGHDERRFRGINRNRDFNTRSENRRDAQERQHLDVTREMRHMVRAQNERENNLERIKLGSRVPLNTRTVATRQVFASVEKVEPLHQSGKSNVNWQYIFYGLQAVYLGGILVQILTTSGSEKKKFRSVLWWNAPTQKLLKVD